MQLAASQRSCSALTANCRPPKRAHRRAALLAAAGGGAPFGGQPQVRASRVPSPDEDREVMHAAFMNAYGQSNHGPRIKGMQEFAGALLARQRIPSGAYSDPLSHIFDEFDQDRDGALTAAEVAAALRSRQVDITDEQAAMFVDVVDMEHHAIGRDEFRELIMHMAAADLHSRRQAHAAGEGGAGASGQEGEWVMSSWEQDEEIVSKLKSWTDNIMFRRFK